MSNWWNARGRRLGIIAAIVVSVAICVVVSLWVWADRTIGERRRLLSRLHESIESLATKCPPDLTQDQWNVAVNNTHNLPGNCLIFEQVNLDDVRRLQRELEEKAKGKVDMELIFWIWDEVAKMSLPGQRYIEKYQKVMLDKMQPSPANGYVYQPVDDSISREHHRLVWNIYASIRSLVSKRPPDLTKDQWDVAVLSTERLPSNYLLSGRVKVDDLRRFQRELEEKAKEKVDMELIFWIWDEYAKLSPAGQRYKDEYQHGMLDQMRQMSAGTLHIHNGDSPGDNGSGAANSAIREILVGSWESSAMSC